MTYDEVGAIVEEVCGDTVDAQTKELIAIGFYNTYSMWGLRKWQCEDLIRVTRMAYWAGQRNAED